MNSDVPRSCVMGFRVLFVSLFLTLTGCDRNSQTSTPLPKEHSATAPSAKSVATANATTQALLEGPRKSLLLGSMPLSLQVPESWNLTTLSGSGIWIVGPAPHGEIRIQVTSQATPFTSQALTLMADERKKEADQSGGKTQLIPMRSIGVGAKVLDQRETRNDTLIDSAGKRTAAMVMDWTVEIYMPQDKNYTLGILHFAMLSQDQYQLDKDFLEKIIATLRYDPAKGLLQ